MCADCRSQRAHPAPVALPPSPLLTDASQLSSPPPAERSVLSSAPSSPSSVQIRPTAPQRSTTEGTERATANRTKKRRLAQKRLPAHPRPPSSDVPKELSVQPAVSIHNSHTLLGSERPGLLSSKRHWRSSIPTETTRLDDPELPVVEGAALALQFDDPGGRASRARRKTKRRREEAGDGASSATTIDTLRQSAAKDSPEGQLSAAGLYSAADESGQQSGTTQALRKKPKLTRDLSTPNEHGIVVEKAQDPNSLPLSISRRKPPKSKTCKATKVTPRLLAYLGVPGSIGRDLVAPNAESKAKGRLKTATRNSAADAGAEGEKRPLIPSRNRSIEDAKWQQVRSPPATKIAPLPKSNRSPPVSAKGIRSSTFASVMRIVSGICPFQSSPRTRRAGRPSVAPPVWAQVSYEASVVVLMHCRPDRNCARRCPTTVPSNRECICTKESRTGTFLMDTRLREFRCLSS